MSKSTSPEPEQTAGPEGISHATFAALDVSVVVPLAGLLHVHPELRDQALTVDEWRAALTKYLRSQGV